MLEVSLGSLLWPLVCLRKRSDTLDRPDALRGLEEDATSTVN